MRPSLRRRISAFGSYPPYKSGLRVQPAGRGAERPDGDEAVAGGLLPCGR